MSIKNKDYSRSKSLDNRELAIEGGQVITDCFDKCVETDEVCFENIPTKCDKESETDFTYSNSVGVQTKFKNQQELSCQIDQENVHIILPSNSPGLDSEIIVGYIDMPLKTSSEYSQTEPFSGYNSSEDWLDNEIRSRRSSFALSDSHILLLPDDVKKGSVRKLVDLHETKLIERALKARASKMFTNDIHLERSIL
jgi:hypothetical protein